MPNMNIDTGIPFGVVAANSLNPELVQELFYGPQATDLSYKAAYEEAKAEAESEFNNHLEEALIEAAENGADREPGFDPDDYFEAYCQRKGIDSDLDVFVEDELERFSDMCQIDEPRIEGTHQGVTYAISWLGGAPIVYIFYSPWVVNVNSACSPCVPGAGDLDSGICSDGYVCYGIPQDWFHTEQAALF